jgi:glycosidase
MRALMLMLMLTLACMASYGAHAAEPAMEGAARAAAGRALLHVPSPDWRDQIIYFAMIDRFDDGDPDNNDQGAGEYDPANGAHYSGGDLRGLARRLDYIRDLGATAVWITPPVANQWWNPRVQYGGYHGYWASDFTAVDAHYGSPEDYRQLSTGLHARGMYLVQDIVLNHTGDWFSYPRGWDAAHPERGFVLTADSRGRTAPSREPFSHNDARNPVQRAEAIYHWTPDINDYNDPEQLLDGQLAGLDDLNTGNPVVRGALRGAYGGWIRDAGVDAFRLDTAFHVPPGFLRDFMFSDDPRHPGMVRAAAATGRDDFLVFGEGFGIDRPYHDTQEKRIERYVRDDAGRPVLPGMLNFPLYGTLLDVFARGRPTAELGYRLRTMMATHADPHRMPSFVDNHDVDRFLAGGTQAGLKQALLAIMTLPGIPVIYYGTEQGFTEQRAAMFARGFGSGGRDRFDRSAPLYRYLQRVTALRRGHRVFSRGRPVMLKDNAAGPGVFAYAMRDGADSALVAFNSGDHAALLDNVDTGLEAGTVLAGAFAIDGTQADVVVGERGRITVVLPPHAGWVWRPTSRRVAVAGAGPTLTLSPLPTTPFAGDVVVRGMARGVASLRLVVDGDLDAAEAVIPGRGGRWQASIDTDAMLDPGVAHTVVAWAEAEGLVSDAGRFRVRRAWQPLAEIDDPRGDDRGRGGRYRYPTLPGWTAAHPADIERVRVAGAGGALRVEVTMRSLGASWNPPNGFDHVALMLYLQLPGRDDGVSAMPLQNAQLPHGMRWHLRLRVNGWTNALFSSSGASAQADGTGLPASADLQVDPASRTISLLLPRRAFGDTASLSGAKLYLATWDYDGGYRSLQPTASTRAFGGGDGSRDPLVMDETDVIVLP